jgi:ABC-type sugar transport system ATPase subunit
MQAGTPLEIYRRPTNTFVASFIGNPPMNLLPCHLDNSANTVVIADKFPISAAAFTLPTKSSSETLTLGIRPEHIRIETAPTAEGIRGDVYVVQTLGSESLIIARVGEHLVSVRVFGDEAPELPPQVWLVPDYTGVFYVQTGNCFRDRPNRYGLTGFAESHQTQTYIHLLFDVPTAPRGSMCVTGRT